MFCDELYGEARPGGEKPCIYRFDPCCNYWAEANLVIPDSSSQNTCPHQSILPWVTSANNIRTPGPGGEKLCICCFDPCCNHWAEANTVVPYSEVLLAI